METKCYSVFDREEIEELLGKALKKEVSIVSITKTKKKWIGTKNRYDSVDPKDSLIIQVIQE